MDSTTKSINRTSPGGQETQEAAIGGQRSPQGSRSLPGAKGVGMPKQVPTASNGARNSTAVGGRKATEVTAAANGRNKDTNMRKVAESDKDQDTGAMASPSGEEKSGGLTSSSTTIRSTNIRTRSEEELLTMLRGYINSMAVFAQNNRNVHKELKETIANSSKVMSQFIRIRNAGPDTIGKATTNTSIQKPSEAPSKTKADSAQSPDRIRSDISGAILEVKDILNKQSEAIGRLTIQTEALQHQQQQQQ